MRRFFFVICLAVTSAAFAQVQMPSKYRTPAPKPSQAVAKAGGKSILASDVEPYLWEWLGRDATNDIISYVLVQQDASKKGVVVADADVEKAVDDEIASVKTSQGGSQADAEKYLKDQGFTRSRLFMRLKAKLLMDKVLEADFHPEAYVKVATIVVKKASADAAAVGLSVTKAQEAYDRLKKGQPWSTVLSSMTNDKNGLKSQGVLGWREVSAFPDTVQKEMATLPVGGITRPAETKNGIQIFRIDGHGADAKGKELDALKALYMQEARPAYVQRLKSQAGVVNLVK